MSTCRGTWIDEWVPATDETVLMLAHSRVSMVMHASHPTCLWTQPHLIEDCGRFLPVRWGFEPDPDPPPGPELKLIHTLGWEKFFGRC